MLNSCISVLRETKEGFSHAARILACMHRLVVAAVSSDSTPNTGFGPVIAGALVLVGDNSLLRSFRCTILPYVHHISNPLFLLVRSQAHYLQLQP